MRPYLNDARATRIRGSQDVAEIKVVREDDESMFACKPHDRCVGRFRIAEVDPMVRVEASCGEKADPLRGQIPQKRPRAAGMNTTEVPLLSCGLPPRQRVRG